MLPFLFQIISQRILRKKLVRFLCGCNQILTAVTIRVYVCDISNYFTFNRDEGDHCCDCIRGCSSSDNTYRHF